jgi:hypothetical protein
MQSDPPIVSLLKARGRLGSAIDFKGDPHFFEGFNNGTPDPVCGFIVPINGQICPYLFEERKNISIEVISLDDDFSIHLSRTSVLNSPGLSAG